MTTEEKLAAIEVKINGYPANGVWYATYSMQVGPSDVRWLIAEVRRLQALITTGKAIIHDIADGSEYRRGREDEQRDVLRFWDTANKFMFKESIERGEHLEEPDAR